MMRTITVWIVGLLVGGCLYAQTALAPAADLAPSAKKADVGTFQLIQTTKIREAIHEELLITIESKREEDRVVYFDLSPNTRVMVLSRREISRPDFKPLENLYLDN